MALLDEAKTRLRITVDNPAINAEIQDYIESAILDLTKTADIATFTEPDALLKQAIFTYVKAKWTKDLNESEKLMASYDSQKSTLLMSSEYGTFGGGINGQSANC